MNTENVSDKACEILLQWLKCIIIFNLHYLSIIIDLQGAKKFKFNVLSFLTKKERIPVREFLDLLLKKYKVTKED